MGQLHQRSISFSGSYTPALFGLTIGTGGTNTGLYRVSGDIMTGWGRITFGTGASFFTQPASTLSLPTGWEHPGGLGGVNRKNAVGTVTFIEAGGVDWPGDLWQWTATTLRFMARNTGASYQRASAPTSTIPFTWASGDSLDWAFTTAVQRA